MNRDRLNALADEFRALQDHIVAGVENVEAQHGGSTSWKTHGPVRGEEVAARGC